jgi:protein TonB
MGADFLPARPPQAPAPPKKKEYLVDLNPPTPPVEAPKPSPAPETPPVEKTAPLALPKAPPSSAPPQAVPSTTPPPPAQAGQIIAAEPDPSAPVDLTETTFVTGTAANYAGGTTASNGTNDKAVYSPTVDPEAKPGGQVLAAPPPPKKNKIDRSRPVQLDEDNWGCAWPREADAEQIDEQSVVLRVRVNPRGLVESVTLESDPGHGFGAAAVACAKKTRFSPALDPEGQAIAALSPPIRVRFTR